MDGEIPAALLPGRLEQDRLDARNRLVLRDLPGPLEDLAAQGLGVEAVHDLGEGRRLELLHLGAQELVGLPATTGAGLMLYALHDGAGPLASIVAQAPPLPDGAENPSLEFWEETHELVANLTLLLVLLHVAGVIVASIAHRENLVWAMITGRKRRS